MVDVWHYLVTALGVVFINAMPGFMPPTWSVLTFAHVTYKLNMVFLIVIGVLAATVGRIALYWLSRKYFRKLIPKDSLKNCEVLKDYIESHETLTVPLFLVLAFSPIPTNQAFMFLGVLEARIKYFVISFLGGRLVEYTLMVTAASYVLDRANWITKYTDSGLGKILVELGGLVVIVVMTKINWKKVLPKYTVKDKNSDTISE